jgi:hypothetical protein
MLPIRELNRRIKYAVKTLRAAGAKGVAIEIMPDGGTRVSETDPTAAPAEDEGERVGRLIEERLGNA